MTGSWRDNAACLGQTNWTEKHPAKQLSDCLDCPVRMACLHQALADEEAWCRNKAGENGTTVHGQLNHLVQSFLPMYGGLTIRERARLLATRFGEPDVDIRGEPTWRPACGTISGATQHSTHGERPCDDCKAAKRRYHAARRAARHAP